MGDVIISRLNETRITLFEFGIAELVSLYNFLAVYRSKDILKYLFTNQ